MLQLVICPANKCIILYLSYCIQEKCTTNPTNASAYAYNANYVTVKPDHNHIDLLHICDVLLRRMFCYVFARKATKAYVLVW